MSRKPGTPFSFKKLKVRLGVLGVCFLLFFAFIVARSFELHLGDNKKLKRLANSQYTRKVVLAPKRGDILDSMGEKLALDLKVDSVYASPAQIEDPKKVSQALGKVLSISPDKIFKLLENSKKKFVWIKRRITPEESRAFKTLHFEGVGSLPEYQRFYPNGKLASNLLGAVGYEATALAGLELSLDKILKNQNPPIEVEQDARGRAYAPYDLVNIAPPQQVVLTIDKTIQYIAEKELQAAVSKAQAKGGVAVVVDVQTGAILGMAVAPSFDPNNYSEYEFKDWRNRAINDVFEPGSIFKAVTAAAALDLGFTSENDKIHCENGSYPVGKHVIHDTHPYGVLNLRDIIKYSSNICSYKLANRVGREKFSEFIRNFGFGSKTGIEAPGELGGLLAPVSQLTPIRLGTIGFGQGISTTPLQIAMAYAAIANGGELMKPYLLKEIRDSSGKTVQRYEPQVLRRVMREENAHLLTKLLETVVEKGGTGTRAFIEEYPVAGKTGTAQKVVEGQKGYAKNKYFASFVGYAPSTNPRLVISVSIDEPKGEYYGGLVSAPVFQGIMSQSLAYLKVPPVPQAMVAGSEGSTKKGKLKNPALLAAKEVFNNEEPLVDQKQTKKGDKKVASKDKAKDKIQAKSSEKISESLDLVEVSEKTPSDAPATKVPNLTGLTVREVLRRAQLDRVKVRVEGSGICLKQEPAAGSPVSPGKEIVLQCQPS